MMHLICGLAAFAKYKWTLCQTQAQMSGKDSKIVVTDPRDETSKKDKREGYGGLTDCLIIRAGCRASRSSTCECMTGGKYGSIVRIR